MYLLLGLSLLCLPILVQAEYLGDLSDNELKPQFYFHLNPQPGIRQGVAVCSQTSTYGWWAKCRHRFHLKTPPTTDPSRHSITLKRP